MDTGSALSRFAVLAVLSALWPQPGGAADRENQAQAVEQCNNLDGKAAPHWQINGCTLVIKYDYGGKDNVAAAFYARGKAYLKLEQKQQAIADFQRALRQYGDNPARKIEAGQVWSSIGYAYQLMDRPDDAIAAYGRSLAINPDWGPSYFNRALAFRDLKKPEAELADLNQALRINPKFAPALTERGLVYQVLNQPSDALADFNAAIRIDPGDALSYRHRGQVLQHMGQFLEAIDDYTAAIKIDPKYASALSDRCWARTEFGRQLELALADCDAAIEVDRQSAYYDNRGSVMYKLGRWKEAWADGDKAFAMDRNSATALYGRGLAALKLGRRQEGEADLALAAKMDPGVVKFYADAGMKP